RVSRSPSPTSATPALSIGRISPGRRRERRPREGGRLPLRAGGGGGGGHAARRRAGAAGGRIRAAPVAGHGPPGRCALADVARLLPEQPPCLFRHRPADGGVARPLLPPRAPPLRPGRPARSLRGRDPVQLAALPPRPARPPAPR